MLLRQPENDRRTHAGERKSDMENALGGLSQMAVLVIIAAVGYLAGKLGYIDTHTKNKLTQLLLNITLPCMIVASVHSLSANNAGAVIGPAFAMATAQFFLLFATGALLAIVLRAKREDRAVYTFMTICTNNGFIGLPLVAAVLGSESVIISSIYIMVSSFFNFSIGYMLLARNEARMNPASSSSTQTGQGKTLTRLSIPWKSMVNPCLVGSIIALALFFSEMQLPDILQDSLSLLGGTTGPVAMLVVGVIMAETSFADVVREVRLYPYIAIRQLVLPMVFFAGFTALGFSNLLAGVFALMFAMPVGSMAPTFVARFHGNAQLTAKATILTTIGAFITIPLIVVFMGLVG